MQIGYLVQTSPPDMNVVSGPQLHIKAVIQGLEKRSHRVRTFIPHAGTPVWSDDLERNEWHTARYRFSRSFWFRSIESPIRRLQREIHFPYFNLFESIRFADAAYGVLADCDLILERYSFLGYGGALMAARMGVPVILEINGDIPKEMDLLGVEMSPLQRKTCMQVTRRTLARAAGLVCVAPQIKKRLCDSLGLTPEKIAVIPNGADVKLFTRPQDPALIREKYELKDCPTVTFVGSFQPWHGIDLLLDSFRLVRNQVPDAQLVLVGDGAGRAAAMERVNREGLQGSVCFLGQLNNQAVAEILVVTDVAVAPFPFKTSDIVGSPLKIFEYMAAGCAIVASTAPIHDVVKHNLTGLRVEPGDAVALSMGVIPLLTDPALRRRLGTKARQVALERYSWDCTVQQLEAFLLHTREQFGLRTRRWN